MPRSSKIAISLVFGLGIFDIGVGIGRLVTVLQVKEDDFTWTEVPALELLAIEPSIAITVACLCVCRPLMDNLMPKRWRQTFSANKKNGNLPREDYIKLVNAKNGTSHGTTRTDVGAGTDSTSASQTRREELRGNAVHVRNDIVVSADGS